MYYFVTLMHSCSLSVCFKACSTKINWHLSNVVAPLNCTNILGIASTPPVFYLVCLPKRILNCLLLMLNYMGSGFWILIHCLISSHQTALLSKGVSE